MCILSAGPCCIILLAVNMGVPASEKRASRRAEARFASPWIPLFVTFHPSLPTRREACLAAFIVFQYQINVSWRGRRAIRLGAHTPPRGLWLIEFNVSYLICQQEASFVSVDRQCQHCEGLNRYLTFTSDEASFFIHVHFGQRNALETTLMNFVAFSMALHGTAVITLPLPPPLSAMFYPFIYSVFPLNT